MPYKEIITSFIVCIAAAALFDPLSTLAADAEVLRPRVPVDQRDIAKALHKRIQDLFQQEDGLCQLLPGTP